MMLGFSVKIFEYKEKINDEFGIAVCLGDIGRIYSSMGKYEKQLKLTFSYDSEKNWKY